MSKLACGSAWMFINRNLRRNALYCYMLAGIFIGVAQIVGHRYYSANWAIDLLIARLQFDSLGWAVIFTLTVRLWVEGAEKRCGRKKSCLITFIDHVIEIVSRRAAGPKLFPGARPGSHWPQHPRWPDTQLSWRFPALTLAPCFSCCSAFISSPWARRPLTRC